MLFKGFEFIALNYNLHQLKQQKRFCSVPPLLCPLFFILFHSLHFSSLHTPLLPSVTSSYVKVSGFFVYVPIFQPEFQKRLLNAIASACIACRLFLVLSCAPLVLCLSHKCEPGLRWLIPNDKLEIYYNVISKQCICDIQIR